MIPLTIYLTGLIVCFLYDITMKIQGIDPQGGRGKLFTICDLILWPLSLVSSFFIVLFLREVKMIKQWEKNWDFEESNCTFCGTVYIIERKSNCTCRADRKRVHTTWEQNERVCSFRCDVCGSLISECVPGAEYG